MSRDVMALSDDEYPSHLTSQRSPRCASGNHHANTAALGESNGISPCFLEAEGALATAAFRCSSTLQNIVVSDRQRTSIVDAPEPKLRSLSRHDAPIYSEKYHGYAADPSMPPCPLMLHLKATRALLPAHQFVDLDHITQIRGESSISTTVLIIASDHIAPCPQLLRQISPNATRRPSKASASRMTRLHNELVREAGSSQPTASFSVVLGVKGKQEPAPGVDIPVRQQTMAWSPWSVTGAAQDAAVRELSSADEKCYSIQMPDPI